MPGAIKIASNETVHGPLPSVRAAIAKAADNINRYPDKGYVELKERLAKHVNFAPEHIAAGCGSVSLCQQLIQITCTVGDMLIVATEPEPAMMPPAAGDVLTLTVGVELADTVADLPVTVVRPGC